jgi:hypothetical protein
LVLGCVGCARGRATGRTAEEAAPAELVASLRVEVEPAVARLVLHVTNASAHPVTLHFPTAQVYDFEIRTPKGEMLWRWSAGRAFAQVETVRTLAPGETLTEAARWRPGGRRGELVGVGVVPAAERRIEQRTSFVIPAG